MSMQSLFGGESPEAITKRLLAEIQKLGAVRMEATYSGGNDEGGVDSISLFGPDDEEITTPQHSLPKEPGQASYEYNPHPLWDAADDLLGTEFGSWAGDFSAWGTLHADTEERKAWTDGSYEVPTQVPDEGNLSVQL